MFKKVWPFIFLFLIISFSVWLQVSLIFAWPSFFNQINLVLIVLIFTLFFFDFSSSLQAVIISGFWLDIYSFNFFGFYLIFFFLTILLADWILTSWLTNRSLYSFLLLIILTTLSYNIIINLFWYFYNSNSSGFFLWQDSFWYAVSWQMVWGALAALLMFNLVGFVARRFQPFFLKNQ